jgi:hypothetical protein
MRLPTQLRDSSSDQRAQFSILYVHTLEPKKQPGSAAVSGPAVVAASWRDPHMSERANDAGVPALRTDRDQHEQRLSLRQPRAGSSTLHIRYRQKFTAVRCKKIGIDFRRPRRRSAASRSEYNSTRASMHDGDSPYTPSTSIVDIAERRVLRRSRDSAARGQETGSTKVRAVEEGADRR